VDPLIPEAVGALDVDTFQKLESVFILERATGAKNSTLAAALAAASTLPKPPPGQGPHYYWPVTAMAHLPYLEYPPNLDEARARLWACRLIDSNWEELGSACLRDLWVNLRTWSERREKLDAAEAGALRQLLPPGMAAPHPQAAQPVARPQPAAPAPAEDLDLTEVGPGLRDPYAIFAAKRRDEIRAGGELRWREIESQIGQDWRVMSKEQKKPYYIEATKRKNKWQEEHPHTQEEHHHAHRHSKK
jgi:hypothetical protein